MYIQSHIVYQTSHTQYLIFTTQYLRVVYTYEFHNHLLNEHSIELNMHTHVSYIQMHLWHRVMYYNETVRCPCVQRYLHYDRARHPHKPMSRTRVPEETKQKTMCRIWDPSKSHKIQKVQELPRRKVKQNLCAGYRPQQSLQTQTMFWRFPLTQSKQIM